MGYTKAPVNDTHNTIRLTMAGTPFIVSDVGSANLPYTLNYVDCFPLSEKQWGTDPKRAIHKRQAFEATAASSGTLTSAAAENSYGFVQAPNTSAYPNVFFTRWSTYYMYNYSTNTVSAVTTSTSAGLARYASGTAAVDSTNALRICWLDSNDELKTFLQDGTSVTTTTTGRGLNGIIGLVFLNGYLFAVDSTGYKIHNSTVNGVLTTWASTDFIAAEQYADPIWHINKHRNHLVAFGQRSIEFFRDGGVEVGSPLVRVEEYSRRIGIWRQGYGGAAAIEDDLYFLGTADADTLALYRISNFKVEEVVCPAFSKLLSAVSGQLLSVEPIIINDTAMVLINIPDESYSVVYCPSEEAWWLISQGTLGVADLPSRGTYGGIRLGIQFYDALNNTKPTFLAAADSSTTLYEYVPDINDSTSLTALVYSPVLDLGINFYKHICRVDVIGDFGYDNTLTLSYNPTPNYDRTYTACSYTRTPGTSTDAYPMSWYNIGPWRRGSFKLSVTGTDPFIFEGFDIEYNSGAL